jgi:hypothetical protein
LCDLREIRSQITDDLREALPKLPLTNCDSTDPHARKTAAARQASGSVVAFLDADCLPQAGWLRRITDTFHYYPEIAMVHGRVAGENRGWQGQVRRFFLGAEAAEGTPARYTATNNVAFRREVYCEYPFPEGSGRQAVRIQTAAMLRAHYVLWREPGMLVIRDRRGRRQAGTLTAARTEAAIG